MRLPKLNINDFVFFILITFFLITSNGISKFPIFFLLNKASAAAIILFSIIKAGFSKLPKTIKIYFIFIVIAFISGSLFAEDPDKVWAFCVTMFQMVILMLVITQYYVYRGNIDYLILALLINGIVLSFAGNFLTEDVAYGKHDRYTSLLENANRLAMQLLYSGACALYFWRYNKTVFKYIIIALLVVFTYNIFLSGSRKSVLYLVIYLAFWTYSSFKTKKALKYVIAVSLVMAFAGSYVYQKFLVDTPLVQRLFFLEEDSGAADLRISLYKEALDAFATNPLFGIGLDNFRSTTGHYSHSNYAELLATTGVVGFGLFYFIIYQVWVNSRVFSKNNEDQLFLNGFQKSIVVLILLLGFGNQTFVNIASGIFLCVPIVLYEKHKLWSRSLHLKPVIKT